MCWPNTADGLLVLSVVEPLYLFEMLYRDNLGAGKHNPFALLVGGSYYSQALPNIETRQLLSSRHLDRIIYLRHEAAFLRVSSASVQYPAMLAVSSISV